MKKRVVILGAVGALLALVGCLDQGGGTSSYKGPLLRYHFNGRNGIGRDGTATVLKQIDGMKETAALRTHLAQKLAASATNVWSMELPAGVTAQTDLLAPLIEDLTTSESLVEIQGAVGKTETLIAVELSEERARLWNTNLSQLVQAWKIGTPASVTVEGAKGWSVRRTSGPGVQVYRAGKWTLVGLGPERMAQLNTALQMAAKTGRPLAAMAGTSGILDFKANLPGLKTWFPVLDRFPLAPVHLTMAGKGENVRTELRLMFGGPIGWKFEPWQIPTNLITEPLTSFTIGQGIRPILSRFEGLSALGEPMPNQYCSWGLFHQYGHTYFAFPQKDASNFVARIAPRFADAIRHYFDNPIGQFLYASNRGELAWGGGLPGISPTLTSARSGGNEFVYGRLFPLTGKAPPPPAELYSQFQGRNNLMYYDWELSSNRVAIARQFYQLGGIFNQRPPPPIETPSQKWLEAIGMKLGNTVTEVTMSGPQELFLTRKSQVGFTGFELATFSVWLESPGFPYRIERMPPARMNRPGQAPAKSPAPRKN